MTARESVAFKSAVIRKLRGRALGLVHLKLERFETPHRVYSMTSSSVHFNPFTANDLATTCPDPTKGAPVAETSRDIYFQFGTDIRDIPVQFLS